MTAEIVAVDAASPDPEVIARAAATLRRGELVAIPTETVYGLAANALDADAVARIYAAKERPAFNPVIVHLADTSDLPRVAREVPSIAHDLMRRFWPGPLTLVLHRQPAVPDIVTAGLDTVGVRIPASEVTRALIRTAGVPLAAPSANLFTRVSPTTAAHVARQLGDRLSMILDAGPARVGIESTVLDLTRTPPRLLRPGGTPQSDIESVIGPVERSMAASGDAPRPSPGMVERHYAPRTTLRLFESARLDEVLGVAERMRGHGTRVVVVTRQGANAHGAGIRFMPDTVDAYAGALYSMLHELEEHDVEVAFVEQPPSESAWDAIRDRLRRASTSD
ncbi:MAG: threonylcarbamoyl-AMP synthase [Gemmatimonadaceae bacterium]|nr:threonylcarbamoyl-AMP synthase [Gemmatimonadaceae bacterium]